MVYRRNFDNSFFIYLRYYAIMPIKISGQWVWLDYYWAVAYSSQEIIESYDVEYYLTDANCLFKIITGELVCPGP